jgi:hypothetical protein
LGIPNFAGPKPVAITLCSLAAGCIAAFAAVAFVSHL